MQINETILTKPIFEEVQREKLPEGVLCRVTYPICNIGERNANKRVYEKAVWDRVLGEEDLQEKIKNRALFGHAEHPEQTQSNLEKTSHVIFGMWIDEKDNKVYQKIDVLDTSMGRIVDTLLRAGCQVGVSTRAEGDLEEAEDDDGTYQRVVPESYRYVTTDFTADPSTFGVVPQDVKRNIVSTVGKELSNEKADKSEKEFAMLLLESMKCGHKDKCQECGCCRILEKNKVNEELLDRTIYVRIIGEDVWGIFDCTWFEGKETYSTRIAIAKTKEEALQRGEEIARKKAIRFEGVQEHPADRKQSEMKEKQCIPEAQTTVVLNPTLKTASIVGDVKVVNLNPVMAGETVSVSVITPEPVEIAKEVEDELPPEEEKPELPPAEEIVTEPLSIKDETPEEEKESKLKEILGIKVDTKFPIFESVENVSYVTVGKAVGRPCILVKFSKDRETLQGIIVTSEEEAIDKGREIASVLGVEFRVSAKTESVKISEISKLMEEIQGELVDLRKVLGEGYLRGIEEKSVESISDTTKEDLEETKGIAKLYQDAGLPAPKGKGIHTRAFHELAVEIAKGYVKGSKNKPPMSPTKALELAYPTAMKQLGKEKAVKKAHRTKESKEVDEHLTSANIEQLQDIQELLFDKEQDDLSSLRDKMKKARSLIQDLLRYAGSSTEESIEVNEGLEKLADEVLDKKGFLKGKDYGWEKGRLVVLTTNADRVLSMVDALNASPHFKDVKYGQRRISFGEVKPGQEESISTTAKEITDLKVKEASTRAERDKALELLEELTSENQVANKDKALEAKMLVSRIRKILEAKEQEVDALRTKLEEKAKLASELKEKGIELKEELDKVKINLVTDIRKLEKKAMSAAEYHKGLSQAENKVKELERELDSARKECEKIKSELGKLATKHSESIEQLKSGFNTKISEEIEKVRKEVVSNFVKRFVALRLAESELKVDDNSRALLENCKSLEDVDDTFDEILDASRRGALHSNLLESIEIRRPVVDPEQREAERQVNNVFEGMGFIKKG